MNNVIKKAGWGIFGILCVLTGFYPVVYFFANLHFGILSSKSQELLADQVWNAGFYGHIVFGGVALLIGWVQFSAYLRRTRMGLHRAIGKVYIFTVLVSGVCGVFIAQNATGGLSNVIGFSLSGLVWLTTTFLAYTAIRNGQIKAHQNFMIYSYAVCFSAVTLRIWLPTLTVVTGEFIVAYKIVGWLSWVPNLVVAYFIIQSQKKKPAASLVA